MLVAGEVGFDVEMSRPPVPPLRHDAGPTQPDAWIGIDARQQRPEFHGDARPGLVLERAWLDHVFEHGVRRAETAWAGRRKRRLDLALHHSFPALGKSVIVARRRSHQVGLQPLSQPSGGLKLDLDFLEVGYGGVCAVERPIGRFEPCPVEIGRRGAGYVEIKSGIAEGDVVVTSANFLIDAESNLEAALKTMTGPGAPP
jgi:hypothetical protein